MIFPTECRFFSPNNQEYSFKAWQFRLAATDIEIEMKSISFPCPLIEKLSYSSCEIRIFIKADSTNEAFNEKGKKKRELLFKLFL